MDDPSRNHFDLFGIPVGFVVDSAALAERYRDLQRVVHPDRYAAATDYERRISLQQATLVNEAFEILKDPLRRAQYLLGLYGVAIDGVQESTTDSVFLMQQLELREALAEARTKVDPIGELDRLMATISDLINTQVAQMAMQFEQPDPQHLEQARESIRKMQFLRKLHQEAEALEAELEDSV
jgi:molecular chaperone HscB